MKHEFSTNYPRPLAWNYELLADYVDGIVDENTRTNIENELKTSQEASMIVSGIRHFYEENGYDRDGLEEYLDQLAETFKQKVLKPEAKVRRLGFSTNVMRMAAVILLLIASVPLIIWLAQPDQPDANALLAQQLSTPYPIAFDTRDGDSSQVSLQKQAYDAYTSENYDNCIKLLEQLSETSPLIDDDKFILGLSYLYSESPESSTGIFSELVEKKHPFFEEQARWYLGLAYLKEGNLDRARAVFQEISATTVHYKANEAQAMLNALEN